MPPTTRATPRSQQSRESERQASSSTSPRESNREGSHAQHRYRELTLDDLKETLDWFFEERPARKKEEDEVDMLYGLDEKTRRSVLELGKQLARREARQAAIRRETWSPERLRRFEEKRAWKIANPRAAFEEMWEEMEAEKATWSPERRGRYEERVVQLQTGCGLVDERGERMECRECREGREKQERREARRKREVEEMRQEREARERERVRMRVEEAKRELREEREKEESEREERRKRRERREQRKMQETAEDMEMTTLIGSASAMRLARIREWRRAVV